MPDSVHAHFFDSLAEGVALLEISINGALIRMATIVLRPVSSTSTRRTARVRRTNASPRTLADVSRCSGRPVLIEELTGHVYRGQDPVDADPMQSRWLSLMQRYDTP